MKYDFTSIMDRRGRDALAIDSVGHGHAPGAPREGFDVIPMWIADMNVPTIPTVPAAIIERGYHPDQRVTTTELRCLADVAARYGVTAPAVIVIGDVVTLSPHWADRVVEETRPASPAA